jgi:hypothetical protein
MLFFFLWISAGYPFSTMAISVSLQELDNKRDTASQRTYILDSAKVQPDKHMEFTILVLEQLKNKDAQKHTGLPIVILRKKYNSYETFVRNTRLIFKNDANCQIGEYSKISVKNNYFTIEQVYCKGFMYVQSYCTFKIDQTGNIFLHKYGEEYTDRSNPDRNIPAVTKSSKDFGRIKFERVTEDLLMNLMQRR